MRHPSTRAAHAHWETLALSPGGARREAVDPVAMRHALRDVFIVEREPGREAVFAIGGTRICAVLGREVRGRGFVDAWGEPGMAASVLASVEAGSVVAGEALGEVPDGNGHAFEFVMMPLTWRGIPGAAVLGALAPVGPDAWAGQALSSVRMTRRHSFRGPVHGVRGVATGLAANGRA